MKTILQYLCVLLAAAGVFMAAKYLDSGAFVRPAFGRDAVQAEAERNEDSQTGQSVFDKYAEQTQPAETEAAEQSRYVLTFVGDCTLGCREAHTYIDYGFAKVVGEDYGYPFRNVVDYFANDDFTVINLEGPLCDEGNAVNKTHTFRGPTSYIEILTGNSVEFATLANNHSMDYGQKGYDSTLSTLENAGISYVERDKYTIVTTEGGLTIGIYGAVYYLMDQQAITKAIEELRPQVDLLIFAPHWGVEGSYLHNQEQTKLAHAAIDAGADIVYGSHPHVLQPIEEYNGGIIYYSLGNFSFGGNIYPGDYDSALIQQEILVSDGEVTLGETVTVPVCISSSEGRNDYQPVPYEEGSEEYKRVLAKLDGTWKK